MASQIIFDSEAALYFDSEVVLNCKGNAGLLCKVAWEVVHGAWWMSSTCVAFASTIVRPN